MSHADALLAILAKHEAKENLRENIRKQPQYVYLRAVMREAHKNVVESEMLMAQAQYLIELISEGKKAADEYDVDDEV